MTVLKHPMSGALYTLRDDGLVDVENNGLQGIFHFNGQHHSGDLKLADPQILLWIAGPQLPEEDNIRRNR